MAIYLDPKNDLTFKRVFGEHKHLCISLINSMLPLDKPIVSIEYQTNELIPILTDVLRNTIVDVRCTDKAGRQFLVEMQLYWNESFKSRVLLNASKAYVNQLEKADKLSLIKPVYALNFVNGVFEKSAKMAKEYYHYYKIVNINDTEKQIKGLEFLFIELPKFKPQSRNQKKLHKLWMRFLTEINENTTEVSEDLLANQDIREAIEYMERSAYTKEELDSYYKWKIDSMTAQDMLDSAEAIGLEKGLEKGKMEEKIEIAINLLKSGISIDIVNSATGLSIKQIEELIDKTKK